jgi:hypothetical protein
MINYHFQEILFSLCAIVALSVVVICVLSLYEKQDSKSQAMADHGGELIYDSHEEDHYSVTEESIRRKFATIDRRMDETADIRVSELGKKCWKRQQNTKSICDKIE